MGLPWLHLGSNSARMILRPPGTFLNPSRPSVSPLRAPNTETIFQGSAAWAKPHFLFEKRILSDPSLISAHAKRCLSPCKCQVEPVFDRTEMRDFAKASTFAGGSSVLLHCNLEADHKPAGTMGLPHQHQKLSTQRATGHPRTAGHVKCMQLNSSGPQDTQNARSRAPQGCGIRQTCLSK